VADGLVHDIEEPRLASGAVGDPVKAAHVTSGTPKHDLAVFEGVVLMRALRRAVEPTSRIADPPSVAFTFPSKREEEERLERRVARGRR
jgi:hypothetical protein